MSRNTRINIPLWLAFPLLILWAVGYPVVIVVAAIAQAVIWIVRRIRRR
jgi:hypothetical protein